jgi:hypothetical protein
MARKFSVFANKDAGSPYVHALTKAGFEFVSVDDRADFMLIDCEHAGGPWKRIASFLSTRPVFVYPHSPLAYFIWDGHYRVLPVQCNFVIGEAAKRSMEAYGYPNRIEMCGWARSKLRKFAPTIGSRLLFVPARTRGNGKYTNLSYAETTPRAFQFVLDHLDCFEHVTICYVKDFVNEADYAHTGIDFIKTDPGLAASPTQDMLERIDAADLVISCETVACLAVASGKPTVVYNAKAVPATGNVLAAKYELYRQYYEFPLALEEMSIRDMLDVRSAKNQHVEEWKRMNIGGLFEPDKFVNTIMEYLP